MVSMKSRFLELVAKDIVEWLVLQKLIGRDTRVVTAVEWLKGLAPSDIAEKLGISKHEALVATSTLRMYIFGFPTAETMRKAAELLDLDKLVEELKKIEPIIENNKCKICKEELNKQTIAKHIVYRHRGILEKIANEVFEKVRKRDGLS